MPALEERGGDGKTFINTLSSAHEVGTHRLFLSFWLTSVGDARLNRLTIGWIRRAVHLPNHGHFTVCIDEVTNRWLAMRAVDSVYETTTGHDDDPARPVVLARVIVRDVAAEADDNDAAAGAPQTHARIDMGFECFLDSVLTCGWR